MKLLLLAAGSLDAPERTDEKSKNSDETIFGGSEIVVRTPSLRRSFAETRTCEWRVVEGGGEWRVVEGEALLEEQLRGDADHRAGDEGVRLLILERFL